MPPRARVARLCYSPIWPITLTPTCNGVWSRWQHEQVSLNRFCRFGMVGEGLRPNAKIGPKESRANFRDKLHRRVTRIAEALAAQIVVEAAYVPPSAFGLGPWINSRSNSARSPRTVSIKRSCAVVVFAHVSLSEPNSGVHDCRECVEKIMDAQETSLQRFMDLQFLPKLTETFSRCLCPSASRILLR